MPVRRRRRRAPDLDGDYDAGVWHVFVPGVGPGQAYGYRATGRGTRPGACVATRQAPARPLRPRNQRRRSGSGPRCSAGTGRPPTTETDSAPSSRGASSSTRPSTGATTTRPHRYADTVIYELHVKGFTKRHPGCPRSSAGPTPAWPTPRRIAHLLGLGVTAVELLPVHQCVPEAFLVRGGSPTTGATTRSATSRRTGLLGRRAGRAARRPGRGVQGDGRALHGAGSRSCSTWCSTTPPKASPTGRRCVSADSTTRPTTGSSPAIRAPTWTHRLRELPRRRRPDRAAADHGLAAVLGRGDARRRLPVRPGDHPGPPGGRSSTGARPSSTWSRRTPSSSREADRRAVGRRAGGQLRPRPVPAGVGRMERPVPRHHA